MAKTYYTTIGLEIHAELNTNTKMFCNSKNDPDEKRPNVNICPICMGHPGTLPTINKEAVKHVLKVGTSLGSTIATFTEFDRKNYFYPDIPKGYQLSQYKYPLVSGGTLNGVAITRVHLEEDTARSSHDTAEEGSSGEKYSLVDFNRAGVPLMELVTEPVIHSAEEASAFARELQLLLRYLNVGEANMEKGEMRVEANISISEDPKKFGTKVEVKNLNSFRAVERAIAYELERHQDLLERGEGDKLIQETRGWDEVKQKTFSQRQKEDSHDYRYFPDPDLPKLDLSLVPEFSVEALRADLPELPWARRERFKSEYALTEKETAVFVENIPLGQYFEHIITALEKAGKKTAESIKLAVNYVLSDYLGILKGNNKNPEDDESLEKISAQQFSGLIALIVDGQISSRGAKDILALMYSEGGDAKEIAEKNNLIQKNDEEELKAMLQKSIAEHPAVVADYKAGKQSSLQFFIGQVMKLSKGSANPQLVMKVLLQLLQ